MNQQERSEKSRAQILEAALKLYSHQGYRGTSIREVAELAGVSTGNVYHQFPDKEAIFNALLDEYWRAIAAPDFPLNKALAEGAFPDDLEALGRAARESVKRYRAHVALIYVDVVEFEGRHIRKFYSDMARRYEAFVNSHPGKAALQKKLRPGVSPVSAVMLATRLLLHYFAVEVVFGVPNHFGKDSDTVLREFADILSYGMLRDRKG
ncbi:MAG TPA: TetR/AcrR family transcriptional regulator [Vicinamibacteria bacterium]|nr:TetR/AcrR family transcriptional regulator [Vicinamibacteria bacterium]